MQENREQILSLWQQIKRDIMDFRPSNQISSLGSPVTIRMFTPKSLGETEESPQKSAIMHKVLDLLAYSPVSSPLKAHLMYLFSSSYNMGEPAEQLVPVIFGNLEQDDWDLFDPKKIHEHEKEHLLDTIKTRFLFIVGSLFIEIPADQERAMTTEEAALYVERLFAEGQRWLSREEFMEYALPNLPSWSIRAKQTEESMAWIHEFQDHYAVELPQELQEPLRVLRQLNEYKV
ncbi:hypothetical protein IID24_05655 [Patescibacteria group bacterium]|nr:hypothetical protein [Patescibacteria group bacterium]